MTDAPRQTSDSQRQTTPSVQEQIREALSKATPGPWEVWCDGIGPNTRHIKHGDGFSRDEIRWDDHDYRLIVLLRNHAEALLASADAQAAALAEKPEQQCDCVGTEIYPCFQCELKIRATAERQEWRCFHCDEVFTDKDAAREHFGADGYEFVPPACRVDAIQLRQMEADNEQLRHENEELDNTARLWHEAAQLEELIHEIRPKADCYDHVRKSLGIENDVVGFVTSLQAALAQAQQERGRLAELVCNLQAHAKECGWQDVDDPIAALLAWPTIPAGTTPPTDEPSKFIHTHLLCDACVAYELALQAKEDAMPVDYELPPRPLSNFIKPEATPPPTEPDTVKCRGELIEGGELICKCAHGHDGICGFQADKKGNQ